MPSHGSSMQTWKWFRGKYLHTLTMYFSSCWVQSVMQTFWWAHPARRTSIETQQVDAAEKAVLVICHTRELAYQIKHEFDRFTKYLVKVKLGVVY